MPDGETEDEDQILRRLQETASGDAAVRQLRRRYDLLRTDYEALLERLGELEGRLSEAGNEPEAEPPSPSPVAAASLMVQGILAPLITLRDEYAEAVTGIQSIVTGLESMAAGAFKGQRRQAAAPTERASANAPPRNIQVEAKAEGFGDLLDFQERLSAIPGVARVTIHAIDTGRATFVVELSPQTSPDTAGEPEG